MYDSFLGISDAFYLNLFEQPVKKVFQHPVNSKEDYRRYPANLQRNILNAGCLVPVSTLKDISTGEMGDPALARLPVVLRLLRLPVHSLYSPKSVLLFIPFTLF